MGSGTGDLLGCLAAVGMLVFPCVLLASFLFEARLRRCAGREKFGNLLRRQVVV
jgi:hypothetical protein